VEITPEKKMSTSPTPIDVLKAKAAQSTQDGPAGATPNTDASKAALQQTVATTPAAIPADSPFAKPDDPAAPILAAAPISQDDKSNLWDHFDKSANLDDFANRITPILVPDDLKHNLWLAKQAQIAASAAPVTSVDRVADAVRKLATMDPALMDTAESHPNVLRAFTSAKD
jgi:hypothetical protein